MLLFFGLTSYPDEIAYFNSPKYELSNGVRVMALYRGKIVDSSRSQCLKTVYRNRFEHCNFLLLGPVLLKIAYSTQLIDSFPTLYSARSCDKEKLLTDLEAHHKDQSSEIFLSFQAKT